MSEDFLAYHQYLAALYCLTGQYDLMKHHGDISVKHLNALQKAFHSVTLMNAGFYTEARKVTDTYNEDLDFFVDESKQPNSYLIRLMLGNLGYNRISNFLKRHNIADDEISLMDEFLRNSSIKESTILSMLDIAGEFLRSRKLIKSAELKIVPNYKDRTLSISIPLTLSSSEMVALEWDFIQQLFDKMPDAPFDQVHLGFSCLSIANASHS